MDTSTFLSELPLDTLSKNLNNLVKGIIKVDPQLSASIGHNGKRILIQSIDLAGNMSPVMFKQVQVEEVGGECGSSTSVGRDDGTLCYWLPIHFRYDMLSGGSNGTEIVTVWFDAAGEIIETRKA